MNKYMIYRAIKEGKRVFCIPSLNRLCFAKSLEQCRQKFAGHFCMKATLRQSVKYILGV